MFFLNFSSAGKGPFMVGKATLSLGGSPGGGGGKGGEGGSVVRPGLEKSLKIGNLWDILKNP